MDIRQINGPIYLQSVGVHSFHQRCRHLELGQVVLESMHQAIIRLNDMSILYFRHIEPLNLVKSNFINDSLPVDCANRSWPNYFLVFHVDCCFRRLCPKIRVRILVFTYPALRQSHASLICIKVMW